MKVTRIIKPLIRPQFSFGIYEIPFVIELYSSEALVKVIHIIEPFSQHQSTVINNIVLIIHLD